MYPLTIVYTAECDPLSDDGKIVAAGGRPFVSKRQGEKAHSYLRARSMSAGSATVLTGSPRWSRCWARIFGPLADGNGRAL